MSKYLKMRLRLNISHKKRSKQSEKEAARFLGGKVQPASGALPVAAFKADIKTDTFLVDDKITKHESFNVKLSLWRKLAREAWGNDRRPMLRISFIQGPNLYVIDEATLKELLP